MDSSSRGIAIKFGKRLELFKRKANISYAKIHYATKISENHIKNTVKGTVNTGLLHLEKYAMLFGVNDFEMLDYESSIPDRETLQKNISDYFSKIGFDTSDNFKKIGPSYVVEEFIYETTELSTPLPAIAIKDKINASKYTKYKTNDVSRVLNALAEEDIIIKVPTDNAKKPQYYKP